MAGLTLREVGQRLGVSRTALYRHFSDKSSLLAAVARDGFQRFAADLRQGWIEGGETRRGLDLMGVAYVRFAVANPSHYRVMFGDYRRLCAKDPDLEADAAASFDVLLQALIALQAAATSGPMSLGGSRTSSGQSCTASPCWPLTGSWGRSRRCRRS